MAKKEKPSTQDEQNRVESGGTTTQNTLSLTRELLELKLSEGQCRTDPQIRRVARSSVRAIGSEAHGGKENAVHAR